jgi:hypothetical protein
MKDDATDPLTRSYGDAMKCKLESHRRRSARIALLATELRRLAGAPSRAAACEPDPKRLQTILKRFPDIAYDAITHAIVANERAIERRVIPIHEANLILEGFRQEVMQRRHLN